MIAELQRQTDLPYPERLTSEERAYLLELARASVIAAVSTEEAPTGLRYTGALGARRASFVTLRTAADGSLRGCRGECPACRPLVESVRRISASSALNDPRFEPVTPEEVDLLTIEISALTPMRPIAPENVEVGKHGLLIVSGWNSGLLLPQVAPTCGWDREQFFRNLCKKAGLGESAWMAEDVELYGFESESWGEGR